MINLLDERFKETHVGKTLFRYYNLDEAKFFVGHPPIKMIKGYIRGNKARTRKHSNITNQDRSILNVPLPEYIAWLENELVRLILWESK